MKILDVSAGNRAVWFNKKHPDATYVDIRPEVKPDIIADSRQLPFAALAFDLAVFDPPHVNFGKNAEMSKTYGWRTTEEIRNTISSSSKELFRVLRPQGLLALKWNDHDQKLNKILGLMPEFEPLFGHAVSIRTKHASTTYWILLRPREIFP